MSLKQHLAKERVVRKIVEGERDSVSQDWIKAMDNLEMQKAINQDMTSYMAKAKAKY